VRASGRSELGGEEADFLGRERLLVPGSGPRAARRTDFHEQLVDGRPTRPHLLGEHALQHLLVQSTRAHGTPAPWAVDVPPLKLRRPAERRGDAVRADDWTAGAASACSPRRCASRACASTKLLVKSVLSRARGEPGPETLTAEKSDSSPPSSLRPRARTGRACRSGCSTGRRTKWRCVNPRPAATSRRCRARRNPADRTRPQLAREVDRQRRELNRLSIAASCASSCYELRRDALISSSTRRIAHACARSRSARYRSRVGAGCRCAAADRGAPRPRRPALTRRRATSAAFRQLVGIASSWSSGTRRTTRSSAIDSTQPPCSFAHRRGRRHALRRVVAMHFGHGRPDQLGPDSDSGPTL